MSLPPAARKLFPDCPFDDAVGCTTPTSCGRNGRCNSRALAELERQAGAIRILVEDALQYCGVPADKRASGAEEFLELLDQYGYCIRRKGEE